MTRLASPTGSCLNPSFAGRSRDQDASQQRYELLVDGVQNGWILRDGVLHRDSSNADAAQPRTMP